MSSAASLALFGHCSPPRILNKDSQPRPCPLPRTGAFESELPASRICSDPPSSASSSPPRVREDPFVFPSPALQKVYEGPRYKRHRQISASPFASISPLANALGLGVASASTGSNSSPGRRRNSRSARAAACSPLTKAISPQHALSGAGIDASASISSNPSTPRLPLSKAVGGEIVAEQSFIERLSFDHMATQLSWKPVEAESKTTRALDDSSVPRCLLASFSEVACPQAILAVDGTVEIGAPPRNAGMSNGAITVDLMAVEISEVKGRDAIEPLPVEGRFTHCGVTIEETPTEIVVPKVLRSSEWVEAHWDLSETTLGQGSFSVVRRGRARGTDDPERAVKAIDKSVFTQFRKRRRTQISLRDEANLLQHLDPHENIVPLYDWFETETTMYLVMELMLGGDLLKDLLAHGCFEENHALRLFRQLCHGVRHLHVRGIVHRDLKPENVLMTSTDRETLIAKIGDFGISRMSHCSRDCRTFCGTLQYSAPEVLFVLAPDGSLSSEPPGYGRPADIWSLGVVLYVILCGVMPFDDECLAEIAKAAYDFDEPRWLHVSFAAKDLVRHILVVNPRERFDIHAVLSSAWLGSSCAPVALPQPGQLLLI